MNYKIYLPVAGIGSRSIEDLPKESAVLREAAKLVCEKLGTIRSGEAPGSDMICREGAKLAGKGIEAYIPWKGFNNSNSKLIVEENGLAFKLARKFHPAWGKLSLGGQKLQARNCHQVLGWNLNCPVKMIICYTPEGKGEGGTGQALRIAKYYGIKVFDLGAYGNEYDKFLSDISNYIDYLFKNNLYYVLDKNGYIVRYDGKDMTDYDEYLKEKELVFDDSFFK